MRAKWLAVFFAIIPGLAAAEVLPGILDAETMAQAKKKGRQQMRDARQALRAHASAANYSASEIRHALKPTMVRQGTFRVNLSDGTVIEYYWNRTGFAENQLANTDKKIQRDAQGRVSLNETNKGGVRLHFGVIAEEVYALALKMDLKLAITQDAINGQAFRGAKGGIGAGRVVKVGSRFKAQVGDYVDPADDNLLKLIVPTKGKGGTAAAGRAELMRQYAGAYVGAGGAVGVGLDIQAGDMNTKGPEMRALAAAYRALGQSVAGVSGKAVRVFKRALGGIKYRKTSTGEGVWMAARRAALDEGVAIKGAVVVCQGWGEVGRAFGKAALREGAKPIAVEELWIVNGKKVAGTLTHPLGAKASKAQIRRWLRQIDRIRKKGADLATYKGGRYLKQLQQGKGVFDLKSDIVGLNGPGSVVTEKSVPAGVASGTYQGKRKVVSEGANLAQTAAGAEAADASKDKMVIISGDLANLGGVHVSNLEAVQNFFKKVVTSLKAARSLRATMDSAWKRVKTLTKRHGISERKAIERMAVEGKMARDLQRPDAPRVSLERRILGKRASLFRFGKGLRARVKLMTRPRLRRRLRSRRAYRARSPRPRPAHQKASSR